MVYFITGAVNDGKSLRLRVLYRKTGAGDGFFNRKLFLGNQHIGQELVRLTTMESKVLAMREGFIPAGWDESCRYRNYSFSQSGLDFAFGIINDLLASKIKPVFLDEIGPLELKGAGLCEPFAAIVAAGLQAYVVVRTSCLEAVIQKFKPIRYRIIPE